MSKQKDKERDLEADKPLFIVKADPRNFEQWSSEYDILESKHMQPVCGPGFRVHNLKSLRSGKESISQTKVSGRADLRLKTAPSQQAEQRHQKQKQGHHVPRTTMSSPLRERIAPVSPSEESTGALVASPLSLSNRSLTITHTDLAACLKILRPDPKETRKFEVDTRGINLSWMLPRSKSGLDAESTPLLHTLPNIPTDLVTDSGVLRSRDVINSPRSAFVLLSNGVSVFDLQVQSWSAFSTREDEGRHMQELHEASRIRLFNFLTAQYEDVCCCNSLPYVLSLCQGMEENINTVKNAAFIERRKQQSRRLLEASRLRLERQGERETQRQLQEYRAEQERMRRLQVLEEEQKRRMAELAEKTKAAAMRQEQRKTELEKQHASEQELIVQKLETLKTREEQRKAIAEDQAVQIRCKREEKRRQKTELIKRNKAVSEERLQGARATAEERNKAADERKAAFEDQKKEDMLNRKKRNDKLDAERAAKKVQAEQLERERAELSLKKQKDRETTFLQRQEEIEFKRKLLKERHLVDAAEKRTRVKFRAREEEFRKARLLEQFGQKASRIEASQKVKDLLVQEGWKEREKLRLEKEAVLQRSRKGQDRSKLLTASAAS